MEDTRELKDQAGGRQKLGSSGAVVKQEHFNNSTRVLHENGTMLPFLVS